MGCIYQQKCGGCLYRDMEEESYRNFKSGKIKKLLEQELGITDNQWEDPVFIADGFRRRASFTFSYKKGKLLFGFNENKSNNIADCTYCPMLTEKINNSLSSLREFLERFCKIKTQKKIKGKKFSESSITEGDILILEALNGLDCVLEIQEELELDHRMEIFDYLNGSDDIIRFSYRKNSFSQAETIAEKTKPTIKIGGTDVYVAAGTFLQASLQGEETLVGLVLKYLEGTCGKIADLFCGIGTFSYPLAKIKNNKIVAADINESLLQGFRTSVNKQMMHNIEIVEKNLFKSPFTANELQSFDAIVFDPPRAGAKALVEEIALIEDKSVLKKIVAVSCNPHSFIADAKILIESGYTLKKVTMVDQFVYSNHSELVALFTN